MALHINIEDLLSARKVESDRIEYKEGWNPDAIYRTICAFANDFDNIGGGYILIGVEEDEATKTAVRPVKGLSTTEIGTLQQKMIGLNNLIKPVYHPKLDIVEVDGNQIVVLWVPGGPNRPYEVPEHINAKEKDYFYYIRKYANSVKANQEEQQELISLANQVPFDDRVNIDARIENISMLLVKNYLEKIRSRLAEDVGKKSDFDVLSQMELLSGPVEHVLPRNVGLMMFSEYPHKYFQYTQVEILVFQKDDAFEYTEYEPIQGPVPVQIKRTLDFLKDKLIKEKVIKQAHVAESLRISSYPFQAIEETLVNAFYHRDYQQREPIEIRIYPHSVIFINQGGPDRSIKLQAFAAGNVRARRYRNRRLGEFLKELELTEGRATGIPTILKVLRENGSPVPRFHTDDDRSFFEVELFIHPAFIVKVPFTIELDTVTWDLQGIDTLLELLLDSTAEGIAGGIADNIASATQSADNHIENILSALDSNQAATIAGGIAGGIAGKVLKLLENALTAKSRKELLLSIKLVSNANNFETYIQPLVAVNWLTMTIPDKPTSPKQQYLATLKGRLILEFIQKSGIENLESGKNKKR